jgi:hypothetical protein
VVDNEVVSVPDWNTIAGNKIGTNPAGTAAVKNEENGVFISAGNDNVVGLAGDNGRNIISGNALNGILISGDREARGDVIGGKRNLIINNYIGTDHMGAIGVGNEKYGVMVRSGAGNNTIGGVGQEATRNVISGNGKQLISGAFEGGGIFLVGTSGGANNTLIQGNYIGTKANGIEELGNKGNGVDVDGPSWGTTIGGAANFAGNVISGNKRYGVSIEAVDARIEKNKIGKDKNGGNLFNTAGGRQPGGYGDYIQNDEQ